MDVIIGPLEETLKNGTRDNSCGFFKNRRGKYEWFVSKDMLFDTGECDTLTEVFRIFKLSAIK